MKIDCDNCSVEFDKKPNHVARSKHNFCSRKCFGEFNKITHIVKCDECNSDVEKRQSDITKSNKRNGLLFCNKTCAGLYRRGEQSGNWKGGTQDYRKNALDHYGAVCEECGYQEYAQVIEVHHRDHDRENNDLKNLQVLCPTCHRIEHLVKFKHNRDKPK